MTHYATRNTAVLSATEKKAEKMIRLSILGGLLCAVIGFGFAITLGNLAYTTLKYGPQPILFMWMIFFFTMGQVSTIVVGIGIFKRYFQGK
jgi:hypothetical protein